MCSKDSFQNVQVLICEPYWFWRLPQLDCVHCATRFCTPSRIWTKMERILFYFCTSDDLVSRQLFSLLPRLAQRKICIKIEMLFQWASASKTFSSLAVLHQLVFENIFKLLFHLKHILSKIRWDCKYVVRPVCYFSKTFSVNGSIRNLLAVHLDCHSMHSPFPLGEDRYQASCLGRFEGSFSIRTE